MNIMELLEEVSMLNEGATIMTDWIYKDCEILKSSGGKDGDEGGDGGGDGDENNDSASELDIDPPKDSGSGSGNESEVDIDFSIGDIVQDSATKQYGVITAIYGDDLHVDPISKSELDKRKRASKSTKKMMNANSLKSKASKEDTPKNKRKVVSKLDNTIIYDGGNDNWGRFA